VRRSAAALAAVLALAAARASAQADSEALQPAFLELRVNGVPGDVVLVHLDRGDVWVAVRDAERAALAGFAGTRAQLAGREAVSLRSLARDLSFEVDDRTLVLRVTAAPSLLGRRALDLSQTVRPAGIELRTAPSAFLNYVARGTTEEDLSGALEGGVSAGTALLSGSVAATRAGGAVRGLTALSLDDSKRLVRFLAGDAFTLSDPLGGTPIVGGVALARELSLDPYLVRAPLPRATAFAGTPSTLEVWVNGALQRTQALAPGTYDLSQLPVTAGTNDVRVVVRDAFGRTEALETAHYQGHGLLARGLQDWAVHLGAVRRRFGVASLDYGDPLLLARHRFGLTDRLTTGLRLEVGERVRSGGVSTTAALPLGELEAAGAASDDEGELGGAGLLAFRFATRHASVGADLAVRSRRYATSTLRAGDDRALWRLGASATFPVHRVVGLTFEASAARARDAGTGGRLEARTTLPLGARVWLALSAAATRTGTGTDELSGLVQLVAAPAGGGTLDAAVRTRPGEVHGSAGAQRPLPPGAGVGWRVRGDTAGDGTVSALLQAQPSFGRYEASYDRAFGVDAGSLSAAGALVLVNGRLFATRPVDQSFALVQVPGVAGVRVRLEHQAAGRTDASGDLLVPGLLPYYGNRLSIADADVPVAFRVGKVERLVAAPQRGAALVRFDVERLRAYTGSLRLSGPGGERSPSYGTFEVDTPRGTRTSPVGDDGTFWLEDVPAGRHAARVYFEGEACELTLDAIDAGATLVNLGMVRCEASLPSP
jgi:outer membrane usher protein